MFKVLASVLLCSTFAFPKDSPQESIALVQQAAESMNLGSLPEPSHLELEITLKEIKPSEVRGAYVEDRDKDRQRVEVDFTFHRELYIRDGDKHWQQSTPNRHLRVIEALQPLKARTVTATGKGTTIKQREEKIRGEKLPCVTVDPPSYLPTKWCFDPGTKLLRWVFDHEPWRYEYLDYEPFQGRQFARTIRTYEYDRLVAESRVKELRTANPNPEKFSPIASMRPEASWLGCGPIDVSDNMIKEKAQPQYPASARMTHRQGMVIFIATIREDGTVERLQTIQSPDKDLEDSARTAVMKWIYKPLNGCGGSVRFEAVVSVNYTLSG